jgi:hypothetical protein
MKNLLLIIALFCCQIGYAQDVIKLLNIPAFNCKIISQDKSDIQFIIRGDTTLSVKKAPMHLVEYFETNDSVVEQVVSKSTVDSSSLLTMVFDQPLARNYSNSENVSIAKTSFTLSTVLGVGAGICGLVVLLNKAPDEPVMPVLNSQAAIDDFNQKMSKYKKDVESYSDIHKISTGLGFIFGSAALLTAVAGSYAMLREIERPAKQKFSISPMSNGIYMCYRF